MNIVLVVTVFPVKRVQAMIKTAVALKKHASYLQSIACLVRDAEKHDELQVKARELLAECQKMQTIEAASR